MLLEWDPQGMPDDSPYTHVGMYHFHIELMRHCVEGLWLEPEEGDDSPRARAYNAIFPASPHNPPKGQFYDLDLRDPVEFRYGPHEYSQEDYILVEHPEHGLFVVLSFGGFEGAHDRIIWMEMPWDEFVRRCDESFPRLKFRYTRHVSGSTWWYNRSTYPWNEVLPANPNAPFEWTTEEEWFKYRYGGKPVDENEEIPEDESGLDLLLSDLGMS